MPTFIGDVHGWIDRLNHILQQEPTGPYIFLGDLIDRGPDSKAVITKVRELCEGGLAQCVMGNHEYALVRSLGCPELGISPDLSLYARWLDLYRGMKTCKSFGVTNGDPNELRVALGSNLLWLAKLPWIIKTKHRYQGKNYSYLAVHAGLRNDISWRQQYTSLLKFQYCWETPLNPEMYDCLYSKSLIHTVPIDLPHNTIVISGHTHLNEVYISENRIICDTSGGLPDFPLSAIQLPDNKIYSAE